MKKEKALFLGVCLISMVGLMGFTAYAVNKSGCFISSDGKTLANYYDTVDWNLVSKDVSGGWTEIDASSSDLSRTTFIAITSYNNSSLVNSTSGKGTTYVEKTLKANADKFVFTHQIYASNQSTPVATKKTVTIAY